MNLIHALASAVVSQLEAVAARTSTLTGTAFDTLGYEGSMLVLLSSALGTGTSPTLDVKIQHSDSASSGFADITGAAFTQVTDAAGAGVQNLVLRRDKVKRYIRVIGTIAGTTPSFTFGVAFEGLEKYQ